MVVCTSKPGDLIHLILHILHVLLQILISLFEDVRVHPKYETCFQVGWIVQTGLP